MLLYAFESQLIFYHFFRYIVMKLFPSTAKSRKAKEFHIKLAKEIVDEHVSTFDPNHLRDYIDGYLDHANKLNKNAENHTFTSELNLIII